MGGARVRPPILALLFLLLAQAALAQQREAGDSIAPSRVAVKARWLIDGRGGPPLANPVVLIAGDRIQAVGPNLSIPPERPWWTSGRPPSCRG